MHDTQDEQAHAARVAKILELVEGTANPHEAAAAAAAAQRVMAEHALSEHAVQAARQRLRGKLPTSDAMGKRIIWFGPARTAWIEQLGGLVAMHFRCISYYSLVVNPQTQHQVGYCVGMLGLPQDMATAVAVFTALLAFVQREVERLVPPATTPPGWRSFPLVAEQRQREVEEHQHSWRVGFLVGLSVALDASKEALLRESSEYALVVGTPQAVQDAAAAWVQAEEAPRIDAPQDGLAYAHGYNQGRRWDIRTPLIEEQEET